MSTSLLEIRDLHVHFSTERGSVKALRNIHLDLAPKDRMAIVGESGSGKSTTLFAIMKYLAANAKTQGEILFKGEDLLEKKSRELKKIRGREIALVPQEPLSSLNPSLKIGEQFTETLYTHLQTPATEAKKKAIELFTAVNLPDPELIMDKYPHQISGGQIQRVLIAIALSCNPSLLLMDEPTTALDVTTEAKILKLLAALREEIGAAILYITHDLEVIKEVADHVSIFYAGEMVEQGRVEDVYERPLHPYTKGLLECIPSLDKEKNLIPIKGRIPDLIDLPSGCIFHPRCPFSEDYCKEKRPNLKTIHERKIACHRFEEIQEKGLRVHRETKESKEETLVSTERLIRIQDLKKFYGKPIFLEKYRRREGVKIKAVNNVSFDLFEHETYGLVGESGCGKTTIGNCIARLLESTDGDIFYRKRPYREIGLRDKDFRKSIQIIFQNPDSSLNPTKRVRELIGRSLQIFGLVQTKEEREEKTIELLEQVQLSRRYLNRLPYQLSGGEKQRVAIARAFATQPEFIVCDEAVSALDVSVQASILNLLKELQREYGTSYLFISHDIGVVKYISKKIGVMYLGKLMEEGPVQDIFAGPNHPYTEALLSVVPGMSKMREKILLKGTLPSAKNPPSGCLFHTRCHKLLGEKCKTQIPSFYQIGENHSIACHLYEGKE